VPGPLAGSLNAQNAPQADAGGLYLPGYGSPTPAPQPELSLGQIGQTALNGVGAAISIPRLMAWNIGPAIVGKTGQGPQNGAELFQRLGMNYDSPAQRALGHGLGAGLDMLADPTLLAGIGSKAASPLASRLEQFAGSGLQDAAAASQVRAAQPIAMQPGSSLAAAMRRMPINPPALVGAPSPMVAPQVSGRLGRMAGPGLEYQFGRAGAAAGAADMPNFPTPLVSEAFLGGGGGATNTAAGRLGRMTAPRSPQPVGPMDY